MVFNSRLLMIWQWSVQRHRAPASMKTTPSVSHTQTAQEENAVILQVYLKTLQNNWCNTNPSPGWINISLQAQTPQRWAFITCFSSACSLRHSWNQAAGCLRMLSRCWTRCYFGKSHTDGAIKAICLSLRAPCTEWRQTSSTLRATVGRAIAGLVGEMLVILHSFF